MGQTQCGSNKRYGRCQNDSRNARFAVIVLDASVILKWFFAAEPARDKALQIREKHVEGQEIIAAPDLLPYEVANSLATKSTVSEQDALKGIVEILGYELEVHHFEADDYMQIIRIAREHRASAYDA